TRAGHHRAILQGSKDRLLLLAHPDRLTETGRPATLKCCGVPVERPTAASDVVRRSHHVSISRSLWADAERGCPETGPRRQSPHFPARSARQRVGLAARSSSVAVRRPVFPAAWPSDARHRPAGRAGPSSRRRPPRVRTECHWPVELARTPASRGTRETAPQTPTASPRRLPGSGVAEWPRGRATR